MDMKHREGEVWVPMYPKTLADNVTLNNGETIQEKVEEIEEKFPEDVILWEGSSQLNGDDVIKPSKPLSECANGWILVWKMESGHQQFQYTVIPKISLTFVAAGGSRALLGSQGNRIVHKYFYPRDEEITGHSSNTSGDNDLIVLYRVLEF